MRPAPNIISTKYKIPHENLLANLFAKGILADKLTNASLG